MSVAGKFQAFAKGAWAARSGNTAVIFALTLPVLAGFCGLALDVGTWYFKDRGLQAAADIAAYDGGFVLVGHGSVSEVTAGANTGAVSNGFVASKGTITIHVPPVSGTHMDNNSVEVVLTQNLDRYFSSIFSSAPVTVSVRSVATLSGVASACILALNPHTSKAITASGSADINSAGCDVTANSDNSDAIDMSGSAIITAPRLVTVGDVHSTSGLHLSKCTSATIHAPAIADPYASVPAPTASGPCLTVPNTSTVTLSPGNYCSGISIPGGVSATFQPGVYYVGGNFAISGSGVANGNGVTFFIKAGKTTAISGGTVTNFTAPTSGPYSGIVFFGDRAATNGNNAFSGSSSSTITGAIYFPTETVTFSGGSSSGSNCTQLVADTITVSGSAYFNNTCSGTGMANIGLSDGASSGVKLVE